MRRAGRRPEHHEACRGRDRADPLGEDAAQPPLSRRQAAERIGQRITRFSALPYLDRAQLLEVAADGRLRDLMAELAEGGRQLVLARQAARAEQVGKRGQTSVAGIGHANFMHELA